MCASVRPRCSAGPAPFSPPTHGSQARSLHVAGDVSMGVGRLNEQAPTTASITPFTTASTLLAATAEVSAMPGSHQPAALIAVMAVRWKHQHLRSCNDL